MDKILAVGRALSDKNRVRALMALEDRELCACQIIELLGLAPSTVSRHMTVLRQSGLVTGRKSGRWMYYRRTGSDAPAEVREAAAWVSRCLADHPAILLDRERLAIIIEQEGEKCLPAEN